MNQFLKEVDVRDKKTELTPAAQAALEPFTSLFEETRRRQSGFGYRVGLGAAIGMLIGLSVVVVLVFAFPEQDGLGLGIFVIMLAVIALVAGVQSAYVAWLYRQVRPQLETFIENNGELWLAFKALYPDQAGQIETILGV